MGFMQDFTQAFSPAWDRGVTLGQQRFLADQQLDMERQRLGLSRDQWQTQKPLYEADATLKGIQGQALQQKMAQQGQFQSIMLGGPGGGNVGAYVPTNQPLGTPIPGQQPGGSGPATVRNSNPGAIMGANGTIASYATPAAGAQALDGLITRSYTPAQGITNLYQFFNKYAKTDDGKTPGLKGNDSVAYANRVAKQLGVDPSQPIDVNNPQFRASLMTAIAGVEGGAGSNFGIDLFQQTARLPNSAPPQGVTPYTPGRQYAQAGSPTVSDATGAPGQPPQAQSGAGLPGWYLDPVRRGQVYALAGAGYEEAVNAVKLLETQMKIAEHEDPQLKRQRDNEAALARKRAEKGIDNPSGGYEGNGMDGQSWNFIMKVAPKIANGTASDEEKSLYMSAEAHLTAPKISTNTVTGAQEVVQLDLGQYGFPSLRKTAQPQQAPPAQGGGSQPQQGQLPPAQGGAGTGYSITPTTAPKMPEDTRKQLTVMDDILSGINSFTMEMNGGGTVSNKIPFTERKGRLGAAYTMLQMRLKEALNLGVLNGPDLMILQKALQDPTSMSGGWSQDSMKGGLDVIRETFAQKRKALLGGSVPAGNAQPSPSASMPPDPSNDMEGFKAQWGIK